MKLSAGEKGHTLQGTKITLYTVHVYVYILIKFRILPAIDMTSDILQALDDVVDLGFQRVLTSGGSSTALEGLPMIQQMVERVCQKDTFNFVA